MIFVLFKFIFIDLCMSMCVCVCLCMYASWERCVLQCLWRLQWGLHYPGITGVVSLQPHTSEAELGCSARQGQNSGPLHFTGRTRVLGKSSHTRSCWTLSLPPACPLLKWSFHHRVTTKATLVPSDFFSETRWHDRQHMTVFIFDTTVVLASLAST